MKRAELKFRNAENIYPELTETLYKYCEREHGSMLFIVEGTKEKPLVGIRYPGKKVRRRTFKSKTPPKNSALWANLYDFEVVPFQNGEEVNTQKFTFEAMMRDFDLHKKNYDDFWELVEILHDKNIVSSSPPDLPGINSLLYLMTLKWIWIQEDLNYKLSWEETGSPVKYTLETRTGSRTAKGAGRSKFFAALLLLKHHSFDVELIKKIIPFY